MLVGRKRGTPDEIQMPSMKAEQIGMFDSTRSGGKICCNCTTKQKILRPDLLFPHRYFLHKNQNAQVVFLFVSLYWLIPTVAETSLKRVSRHPKMDWHCQKRPDTQVEHRQQAFSAILTPPAWAQRNKLEAKTHKDLHIRCRPSHLMIRPRGKLWTRTQVHQTRSLPTERASCAHDGSSPC